MQMTCEFLTPEQKEQYFRDGYCVVDGLYTSEEIDAIEKYFEEERNAERPWFDGGVKKIDEVDKTKLQVRALHPHRYSDKARTWALNSRVGAVLEELLEKPPLLAQTMYYFKPPGASGQGMHQDNVYLLTEPCTCIAAWTAIDTADLDNGCLWVVPTSNHGPILCPEKDSAVEKALQEKSKQENGLEYGATTISKFPRGMKPVPVRVPRGSTMFFGGNMIHGSGPNRTKDRSRRTFIGHYIDEASTTVARFYHPVLNFQGDVMGDIAQTPAGGPCGDSWVGAVH